MESSSNVIALAAYGNFGQHAGSDPTQQANDYKTWLDAMGTAGFNVLVMSTFHVDPQGNLYDTAPLATNGIFNPLESTDPSKALNPQLPGLLASFKSTYNAKVYYSIGNWAGSSGDMANLQALLAGYSCESSKSNPTNPNYDNLVTNLKLLISDLHIDGIDLDFEPHGTDPYSSAQQTMVSQFTCLLHDLGFGVTYDPFTEETFWINAQADACDPGNTGSGTSKVDWWNLQCYSGGFGNDPNSWTQAIETYISTYGNRLGIADPGAFVIPGYSGGAGSQYSSPGSVQGQISAAVTGTPTTDGGGWIWQLGQFDLTSASLETELAAYANAIKSGLGGT